MWAAIRDFGALASWHPAIARSGIEAVGAPDEVGYVKSVQFHDGGQARERLLMLDDSRYVFGYNFERPAFPVSNYIATFELILLTNGDATFPQWCAEFDEPPQEAGKYIELVSKTVFAVSLAVLAERRRLAARLNTVAGSPPGQGVLLVGAVGVRRTRMERDAGLRRHVRLVPRDQ